MKHKNGCWIWVLDRGSIISRSDDGKPLLMMGTHQDVTARVEAVNDLEKSFKEKTVLLREVHHRVKNNMAVITSLLSLQKREINNKQQALAALDEVLNRILSMAQVHDQLYQTDSFSEINIEMYIKSLTHRIMKAYSSNQNISTNFELEKILIDINKAVPLGLLLNELITNACKHAFTGRTKGNITISFTLQNKKYYRIIVEDDGIGLPEDVKTEDKKTLGMTLIHVLAEQLYAEIKIERLESGTKFIIEFNANSEKSRCSTD